MGVKGNEGYAKLRLNLGSKRALQDERGSSEIGALINVDPASRELPVGRLQRSHCEIKFRSAHEISDSQRAAEFSRSR